MDESGDLGFNFKKKGTSKNFIITALIVLGPKTPLEKIVEKTHRQLAKSRQRRIGVLHSFREKPLTRRRLLSRLAEQDHHIIVIILNKEKVHTKLQDEKPVLYNFVTNILLDRIQNKKLFPTDGSVELIASKRETNRFLNQNFKDYLANQAKSNHNKELKVTIKTPSEEKILQATDFVSWAIFRKYETGDSTYYRLIKSKIIEESPLFP